MNIQRQLLVDLKEEVRFYIFTTYHPLLVNSVRPLTNSGPCRRLMLSRISMRGKTHLHQTLVGCILYITARSSVLHLHLPLTSYLHFLSQSHVLATFYKDVEPISNQFAEENEAKQFNSNSYPHKQPAQAGAMTDRQALRVHQIRERGKRMDQKYLTEVVPTTLLGCYFHNTYMA